MYEASVDDLKSAALSVFSKDELRSMPLPMLHSVLGMISRSMAKRGPDLDIEELGGIREIVAEHLYPGAWIGHHQQQNSVKRRGVNDVASNG